MSADRGGAIAVIGMGICSPAGSTLEEFWSGLQVGGPHPEAQTFDLVPDWKPRAYTIAEVPVQSRLDAHQLRRLDRNHLLALSAATDAMSGIGLPDPDRLAVVVGTGFGAGPLLESEATVLRSRGPRRVSPMTVPLTMPNSTAAMLAAEFEARGVATTVAAACASGASAIAHGADMLRQQHCDMVIAGGVESLVHASPMWAFHQVGALSSADIERPSRPFDVDRDGFVMAEAAAFVVMVRTDDVGNPRHGHILGSHSTTDPGALVAPSADLRSMVMCMRGAIEHAGLETSDIVHINSHGSSTKLNDLLESRAVAEVFGSHSPPLTATKGSTGHAIGASGAIEIVAAILSATRGSVPPVGGLTTLDASISVDVVADKSRSVSRGPALTNSFAFGGHNVSIVVGP